MAHAVDLPGDPDEAEAEGVVLVVMRPPEFDRAVARAVAGHKRAAKAGAPPRGVTARDAS